MRSKLAPFSNLAHILFFNNRPFVVISFKYLQRIRNNLSIIILVNLILDTQTWLYLANGFNQLTNSYDESGYNFKLLADLQKLKQSKKVEIFANDVLIEKWQRNKAVAEASIKKLSNSVDGSKNFLKGIKKLLSEDWQKIADDLSVEVEKKAMRKF